MYTAICCVLFVISITCVGAFIGSVFDYMNLVSFGAPRIKWSCLIVGVAIFVSLIMGYGYGREKAIENLTLGETTETGYTIILDGEEYYYIFN